MNIHNPNAEQYLKQAIEQQRAQAAMPFGGGIGIYPKAATEVSPPPPPTLMLVLGEMAQALSAQDKEINELCGRLNPILGPDYPNGAETNDKGIIHPEAIELARTLLSKVYANNAYIASIRNRVRL